MPKSFETTTVLRVLVRIRSYAADLAKDDCLARFNDIPAKCNCQAVIKQV